MAVLIRGMEMPKDCKSCRLRCRDNMNNPICVALDWAKQVAFFPASYGRCNVCPLIEVPEPHGRLGDLDRLEQMFVDIDNAPYSGFDGTEPFYSAEDAAQIIRLAPTVIRASEEGE